MHSHTAGCLILSTQKHRAIIALIKKDSVKNALLSTDFYLLSQVTPNKLNYIPKYLKSVQKGDPPSLVEYGIC